MIIKRDSIEQHDFNRAQADHDRSNWRHTLYLEEDGSVDVSTIYGNGQPMTAYHQRDLWLCSIPDGTADVQVLIAELENMTDDLRTVKRGHEIEWNGSNHVGTLTEDAEETLDDIRQQLEQLTYPSYWDAMEWLTSGGVDRELIGWANMDGDDRDQIVEHLIDSGAINDQWVDKDDLNQALDRIRDDYCARCCQSNRHCECATACCQNPQLSGGCCVNCGEWTKEADAAHGLPQGDNNG